MSSPTVLAAPSVRLRRAKPLLGTLVDVCVEADDTSIAQRAIDAAFAEIRVVHRLMSFHEEHSDLSRLNRADPGAVVRVDARTAEVLRAAAALREDSGGVFDCAVAGTLMRLGLLPPVPAAPDEESKSTSDERVAVVRGADVLDLGGIAKGYAVDRAIQVLRRPGVICALVNAGGDLRHFGPEAAQVHLRDPADPSRLGAGIAVRNIALASSATSGLSPDAAADRPSPFIDARRRAALAAGAGVSVMAPRCMIADALTKIVLVSGDRSHPLLKTCAARVVLHRPTRVIPA